MVEISKEVFEIVNKPGRVGVLGTADKQGQPNTAYFGSLTTHGRPVRLFWDLATTAV